MKRTTPRTGRLDALIVQTERRIAEQVDRIETGRYGALASRLAMYRLADLRVDLCAYKQAREAVAEVRYLRGPLGGAARCAVGETRSEA